MLFVESEGGIGKRVTRRYVLVCVNSVDGQHRRVLVAARVVYSPLEVPELCKLAKITRIGRYHCYSQTPGAHAQSRDVDRCIEEHRLHLLLQGAVDIRNGYAAFHEALIGFHR